MTELHFLTAMFERQGHKTRIEYRESAKVYFLWVECIYSHKTARFVFDNEGRFNYMVV